MKYVKIILIYFITSILILIVSFLILTSLYQNSATKKVYEEMVQQYRSDFASYATQLSNYNSQYDTLYFEAKNSIIENENEQGYGYFTLHINIVCDYNNSVGNEWIYNTYINNKPSSNGDIVYCPLYSDSSFYVECIEDDIIPDFSSKTYNCQISDSLKFNIYLINVEQRGRYTGNTAKHTFYYSFDRYVSENDILSIVYRNLPKKPVEPISPSYNNLGLSKSEILYNEPVIYVFLILIIALFTIVFRAIILAQKKHEKELLEAEIRKQEILKKEELRLQEQKRIEEEKIIAYEKQKRDFIEKYGNKSKEELLKIVGAPQGATVDNNGKPIKIIDGKNLYCVYTTPNGNKYHTSTCRYAKLGNSCNLFNILWKEPCSLCNPPKEDFAWCFEYNKIIKTLKKYKENK